MYSPETQSKLALWRQKVADNTITDEEMKEATELLRGERKAAMESSAKRRKAAKASVKSGDDLLDELSKL